MNTLNFRVAEVNFALHCADTEELKTLIPSYAPFWLRQQPEEVAMNVHILFDGALQPTTEIPMLGDFDCGDTSHVIYQRPEGGYELCIHDLDTQLAARLITNADFSECTIHTASNDANRAYGLGNALMIAYTFAAAKHRVVLMHASVAMCEGRAYMFLGKSGTGKSTHSSLWLRNFAYTELLNDDNPAVRINTDATAEVYGTPWSGKTPCYRNLHLPLGAVVRLQQAPHNKIRREPTIDAFASVISSCSAMIWDKTSYQHICRTAEAMALYAPVFMLECLPDDDAAILSHNECIKAWQS